MDRFKALLFVRLLCCLVGALVFTIIAIRLGGLDALCCDAMTHHNDTERSATGSGAHTCTPQEEKTHVTWDVGFAALSFGACAVFIIASVALERPCMLFGVVKGIVASLLSGERGQETARAGWLCLCVDGESRERYIPLSDDYEAGPYKIALVVVCCNGLLSTMLLSSAAMFGVCGKTVNTDNPALHVVWKRMEVATVVVAASAFVFLSFIAVVVLSYVAGRLLVFFLWCRVHYTRRTHNASTITAWDWDAVALNAP